jgi:hypothetical protein
VRVPTQPPVAHRPRDVQPVTATASTEAETAIVPAIATDYSDLWWCAEEPGWGLSIHHHGGARLVATWHTYGSSGEPIWYSLQEGSWTSAARFETRVFATTGPHFDTPFASRPVTIRPVGTATLEFADAQSAQFSYAIDAMSGRRSIRRMSF